MSEEVTILLPPHPCETLRTQRDALLAAAKQMLAYEDSRPSGTIAGGKAREALRAAIELAEKA